jgi:hypothetical protein
MNGFKSQIMETEAAPLEQKKKKFHSQVDMEEAEVKLLEKSDVEEAGKVMRKCLFSVTDKEIEAIIAKGMSYGAFVDRMLVAVALSWAVRFNPDTKDFEQGQDNAVFLEDDAILLAYEGKGIRELLIEKREEEGTARRLKYAVAITSQAQAAGESVSETVKQRGNKTEKALLKKEYKFFKTKNGVIAYRNL